MFRCRYAVLSKCSSRDWSLRVGITASIRRLRHQRWMRVAITLVPRQAARPTAAVEQSPGHGWLQRLTLVRLAGGDVEGYDETMFVTNQVDFGATCFGHAPSTKIDRGSGASHRRGHAISKTGIQIPRSRPRGMGSTFASGRIAVAGLSCSQARRSLLLSPKDYRRLCFIDQPRPFFSSQCPRRWLARRSRPESKGCMVPEGRS